MTKSITGTNFDEVLADIKNLLEAGQLDFVRNIFADLHPADISDLIEHLNPEERKIIFTLLPAETASEVLIELEDVPTEDILEELEPGQIAEMINQMDSDDAADVLSEMPVEKASEVLSQVEKENSEEIQELLTYPEDSAGGIMAKEFFAVNASFTVKQAVEKLRKSKEQIEDLYNFYVVGDFDTLLGSITLKDLILADPKSILKNLMDQNVIAIESNMDQEEVARFFQKYDLVSAPVVDERHRLIGRITIDDIVDVISEETDEDLGLITGTGEEEILEDSVFKVSRARLPWLILSFLGGIVSAFIMETFSATLSQILAVAFFIPIVMGMGGSIGQQSSIIVVRGLATGEIAMKDTSRRLWRELRVGIISGFVLSGLIFIVVTLWQKDIIFATILACTLVIVLLNASLFGAMIPFFFKKLNVDPAYATGPFVATFNDVVGLLIYFSLLTISLKFLF
jgi:magnesium transporter